MNINVEFTQEDVSNLNVFMNRLDLKGEEVVAFVSIMSKLEKAVNSKMKLKSNKREE